MDFADLDAVLAQPTNRLARVFEFHGEVAAIVIYAEMFVESQVAQGFTASYDALEAAFGYKAEAIYFLTDGAPHGGKISVPQDIVAAITKGNQVRRESIYTIGIAPGPVGSLFDEFLKALADQNQGVYRRVEQ